MRTIGLVSLTALILTGLPPVPIEPAAAQGGESARRRLPGPVGEDPDARCRPFLEGFRNDYAGAGSSGVLNHLPQARSGYTSATPPPAPA